MIKNARPSNSLIPDQTGLFIRPDPGLKCLQTFSAGDHHGH